jgi:UDP-glucose 4-epimerase
MKNLILGGAGFIGSNLCEELLKANEEVFIIDRLKEESFRFISDKSVEYLQCDLTNSKRLLEVFKLIGPDRVFHLAANSDIKVSSEKPIHDVRDTFLTTAALVQVAAEFTLQNVFFASSSAVYGPKTNVISENDERNPISAYGWMKFSSEEILIQSATSKSIKKLMIYRFPNVVGKYMTHGVVYDLINKLIENNHKLEILGDGNQSKPYMLADELCKLIISGQSKSRNIFEILNISPTLIL